MTGPGPADPVRVIPSVTAVILAYRDEPWLEVSVQAVLESTDVDVDVIVVDNGCTSDAVDRVKGLAGVRVIRPDRNLGYAGGTVAGAAEATGDYMAFVNSDAVVTPPALARLTAVAAEPDVGLAMGSIRLAADPSLMNTAGNPLHYAGLSWSGGFEQPASAYATRRSVPCGSGCAFVIAAARWREVGGMTAEYFAYHEDAELSVRLWQRALRVEYVPDAVVVHHYEFSRNAFKSYLLERNRLVFVLTTYQAHSLLVLAPMLLVTEVAMVLTALGGGWVSQKAAGWAWLWQHRRWLRAHRTRLQGARTVPDRDIAKIMTGDFRPGNVASVRGQTLYNAVSRGYWSVARRLL